MAYREELREVQIEEGTIQYRLIRKPVKNINLRIRPEGAIHVSANKTVPAEYIDDFVRSKQIWISNALEKSVAYKEREGQPRQYVSGESFRILGKNVRLKVLEGTAPSAACDGVFLYLTVKDKKDYEEKQRAVNDWLAGLRENIYKAACADMHDILKKYSIPLPEVRIKDMISRWGSCQPKKNRITLNSRLIEYPKNCIEYVVLHELAHFIYPNHSKAFYDFLSAAMPDWKERKKRLEEFF